METAKVIKEKYGYICPDVAKEFNKYDAQPEKWFKLYESVNSVTNKVGVLVDWGGCILGGGVGDTPPLPLEILRVLPKS